MYISFSIFFLNFCNEVMDVLVRHECPCPRAKFMIGSHSRSSIANVARVYPPRMLVSLMGCKRGEGIWRMDEWVNEPYTEGETGRENAPDPREKCSCTNQINHSCRSLGPSFSFSLAVFFSFYAFSAVRLSPSAQCKLRRVFRFAENSLYPAGPIFLIITFPFSR